MGTYRKNFLVAAILEILDLGIPLIPLESPYEWLLRKKKLNRHQYRKALNDLSSRGVLSIVRKQNQEFIKLTEKGALKVLLEKAKIKRNQNWDGKWRVLIFDIPEDFKLARDHFRKLLKQNTFIKLQASVFISPYSLSREAITYLREINLINFVRIMKVEEMDNDSDLRKKFGL